jgi:hypothetical protein
MREMGLVQTLGQTVVTKFVARIGDPREAAAILGISEVALHAYLDGRRPVPESVWLIALDYVMDEITDIPRVPKPKGDDRN